MAKNMFEMFGNRVDSNLVVSGHDDCRKGSNILNKALVEYFSKLKMYSRLLPFIEHLREM